MPELQHAVTTVWSARLEGWILRVVQDQQFFWEAVPSESDSCEGGRVCRVEPNNFQVHVDVELTRASEFRELALWWLDSLHELFIDKPGFDIEVARSLESGWGYYADHGPIIAGEYDRDARLRFAEVLEAGPGDAAFSVYGTHHGGRPVGWVKLRCSTLAGEPTKAEVWVQLALLRTATPDEVDEVEFASLQLLLRFLDRWRPLFACISDDFDDLSVALDKAQHLNGRVARLDADKHLRGYSWVTYVQNRFMESVPDLGSASPGVFAEVTPMADGVLLRASEHLRDFEGDRVRAVRDALSPVLRERPAKQSRHVMPRMRSRHLRIAWDDGTNGPIAPAPTDEELAEVIGRLRSQLGRGES